MKSAWTALSLGLKADQHNWPLELAAAESRAESFCAVRGRGLARLCRMTGGSTGRAGGQRDRWPIVLLVVFAALGASVVLAASLPESSVVVCGWLFGVLAVLALGALSVRPATRFGFGRGAWAIVAATLVVQLTFTGIVLSYVGSAKDELWGPFPAPTTWFLLIFYPSHLLFVVVFVRGFRTWFWTEDDEARFERLVRSRREHGE